MNIFFLYELSRTPWDTRPLLLRVTKEQVSSCNTSGEELAELIVERKRDALLRQAFCGQGYNSYRLLGSFELSPEGDELYAEKGGFELPLWYVQTAYGSPHIVLSQADTVEDFYQLVVSDEDLNSLGPIFPAERVQALFYTERDCSVSDEEITGHAEQEQTILDDLEDASVELFLKKRFVQVFLEQGWSFGQVYEVLEKETLVCMTAQYQINEDRPPLTVSFRPTTQCLSLTLKASPWAAERKDTVLRIVCKNGRGFGRVLESIVYYKDWFEYDAEYTPCGYEKMLQKLAEQGLTVCFGPREG